MFYCKFGAMYCTKMRLAAGLRPDPLGKLYTLPDLLAFISGREGGKGRKRLGIVGSGRKGREGKDVMGYRGKGRGRE